MARAEHQLVIMSSLIHLYLARHGRTEWNHLGRFQGHSDVPLDDVGRVQAHTLAQTLRGKVQAVISSNLLRASETARIVAADLALPILAFDADLCERGYGIFEGLTRAECMEQYPAVWAEREANRDYQTPGGESRAEIIERMQRGLTHAVELLRGRYDHGLVVTHGSSLRMFIETLTGVPGQLIGNMEYREVLYDGARFSYLPL
jgi:broad specificity phosphatase PhoE